MGLELKVPLVADKREQEDASYVSEHSDHFTKFFLVLRLDSNIEEGIADSKF